MTTTCEILDAHDDVAERLLHGRDRFTALAAMGPGQPDALIRSVIRAAREKGVMLTLMFADLTGRAPFLGEDDKDAVERGALRLIPLAGSVAKGWDAHYDEMPHALWDVDRLILAGQLPVDGVLLRLFVDPNSDRLSYGDMVGYSHSALQTGAVVCADIVTDRAAALPGSSVAVDTDRISFAVRVWDEPARTEPKTLTPSTFGQNIVDLIPDGATLQLGIGSLAETVLAHLDRRRNLTVRSGIISPLFGRLHDGDTLCRTGRHAIETTGLVGDGAYENVALDSLLLRPVSETHNPRRLGALKSFWAVNSALEVDLFGHVNAEFIKGRRIALAGGQSDFVRAAHVSEGGASVIALPSRTPKRQSRIVARLDPARMPTTQTQDIDFVVSEQGVACLRGLTLDARRRAILQIAHPEVRDDLIREAGL